MGVIVREAFQNLIPPLSTEEYALLEKSLIKEGCRDPLIIWNNILIDGHNRKSICDKHKIPYFLSDIEFKDEGEAKLWIIKNQLGRRNISSFVKAELALQMKPLLAEKAIENKRAGVPVISPEGKLDVREEIAKKAGIGSQTISKVEKILKVATPEQIQDIREEKKSINSVYKGIRQQEKREEQAKEYADNPLPDGVFDVIYADPPWKYDFAETESRAIENQYPTMTLGDICSMEIPAAENSVLFLWATAPKLQEALKVMNEWAFDYKTCAVWNKETIGMGYWFRGQHELLLVGVKGKVSPPEPKCRYSSVINEAKSKHSKKPDIVYKIIEDMFPNRRYLEMFARKKVSDKWSVWGNQTG
jgi:N6-adenosine-specific RNA methylase IME4